MEPSIDDQVVTLRTLYRQMVPAAKLSSLLEQLTSYEHQEAVYNQVRCPNRIFDEFDSVYSGHFLIIKL
jgi:hypothetical protein